MCKSSENIKLIFSLHDISPKGIKEIKLYFDKYSKKVWLYIDDTPVYAIMVLFTRQKTKVNVANEIPVFAGLVHD